MNSGMNLSNSSGVNNTFYSNITIDNGARKRKLTINFRRLLKIPLYLWIIIVSISSIQLIVPWYGSFFIREAVTLILLIFFVLRIRISRHSSLFFFVLYLLFFYWFIVVARSSSLALQEQLKLYIRLSMFPLLALFVFAFISSGKQARGLLLFMFTILTFLALSGPLQIVTSPIPWLYSSSNEYWELGRAGYARFLSLLGDPNIGGIIGGLLPLTILALRDVVNLPKKFRFIVEMSIWGISAALVSSSLSLTGIFTLACCIFIVLWQAKGSRSRIILEIILTVLLGIMIVPDVATRIWGTVEFYASSFSTGRLAGSEVLQSTNLAGSDLIFRLLAYWDVNDTPFKILFGSTYDIVVPNSYFNPSAILAHNGYKELYLAGGIVGLAIYGLLLWITAHKAFRLIRHGKNYLPTMYGMIVTLVSCFVVMSALMLIFPVHHYNGVALIYWVTVGLINLVHDNHMIPMRRRARNILPDTINTVNQAKLS